MARNWDGDELTSMAEACDHCAARANEPCVLGCECPACLERRGKLEAWARWDVALALMFELGWPLTKAAYLVAATLPDTPDFPLDAELRTSIPDELEGELPESKEEYYRVRFSLPGPAPSASSATSDSTIRPSVASLPPEPDEERALPDAQQQHNLLEEERRALAALGLPPFPQLPEEP